MPRLPTFTVQHETLGAEISGGRRATPADAGAGVGEALQGFGQVAQKAVGDIQSESEAADVRRVILRNAQIREEGDKDLDEAKRSGGDTDKVWRNIEDKLAGVRNEMRTKRGIQYADQHSADTRALFNGKVGQIKVERARADAVLGGQQLMQSIAGLIYSNPAYLSTAETSIDEYAAAQPGMAPHARAALAEALKKQARGQAAMRAAELDPEGTKAALKAGRWKLSPEQIAQVDAAADAETRNRRTEDRLAKQDARQARHEQSSAARDEHIKAIETMKPGESAARHREILKDTRMEGTDREAALRWLDAELAHRENPKHNPAGFNRLYNDIAAERITDRKALDEALGRGEINPPEHKELLFSLERREKPFDREVNASLRQAERLMVPRDQFGRITKEDGLERFQLFVTDVQEAMKEIEKISDVAARKKAQAAFMDPRNANGFHALARRYDTTEMDRLRKATDIITNTPANQAEYANRQRYANAPAIGTERVWKDGIKRRYMGGDPTDVLHNWVVVDESPLVSGIPK